MSENRKRQLLILVAFLLPLIFVSVVIVVSIFPSATLSTEYNFLYATCLDGRPGYSFNCRPYLASLYQVEDGKLVEKAVPPELDSDRDGIPDIQENYRARLFIHDTAKNQSQEVRQPEAEQLQLSDLLTSPDGLTVEWDYQGGGDFFFVFGSRSRSGYYLTRGNGRQRLELINDSNRYYYQDDLLFLGWILE